MQLAWRLAALVPLLLAAPASGLSVSFTKIADASMLGPAWLPGSQTFFEPALDDGIVAFAVTDGYSSGILTGSGGPLTTVVDGTTLVPGSTTAFSGTSDVSISDGNVAFMANDASYFPAIYTTLGGALTQIAYFGMPSPGGGSTLQISQRTPSIDGENVAFLAFDTARGLGYFTNVGGSLEVSADASTSVPGGGILEFFGPPALDGTSVAFSGNTATTDGIYVASAGVARVVADSNTPVPGGSGTFVYFTGILAFDDGNIVFGAANGPNWGLYAEIGGSLTLISDEFVHAASISGDVVAWHASSVLVGLPDSYTGLFVLYDGQREMVIEASDVLDGRVVSYFDLGPEGLAGDQLAFTAYFEDGTSGVYLANIPEPGTAFLLATGLLALGVSRRPRARAGGVAKSC